MKIDVHAQWRKSHKSFNQENTCNETLIRGLSPSNIQEYDVLRQVFGKTNCSKQLLLPTGYDNRKNKQAFS